MWYTAKKWRTREKELICSETCKQQKNYLKWRSKLSYMSLKIFDNNLVETRTNKVTLTLNEPAYVAMCVLELSKVLMPNSIMIILKINIVTTQDFYFKTLIYDDVYEHFSIGVGFIIVFIRLSQNTMIQKN